MTTAYPSIASPDKTLPSLHAAFMQARQTITLLTVNAQLPSQSTLTQASQIFATPKHVADAISEIGGGIEGPAGPPGEPGVGFPDAPANGTTYGRNNNSWLAVSEGSGGGITDAPADGTSYARNNSAWKHLTHSDITDWATQLAGYLPIFGGTLTGPLHLAADPTVALGAVTKAIC